MLPINFSFFPLNRVSFFRFGPISFRRFSLKSGFKTLGGGTHLQEIYWNTPARSQWKPELGGHRDSRAVSPRVSRLIQVSLIVHIVSK